MMASYLDSLLIIIMLSSGLLCVLVMSILLIAKYRKHRSLPYLLASAFFLFQIIGIDGILIIPVLDDHIEASFDIIFRPYTIITGFITLLFVLLYIVDIKHPGKLSHKYVLLSISPFLAAAAILILLHPNPIHSLEDLSDNIMRPDVSLRLVLICLLIAYPIIVIFQPHGWSRCVISKKLIIGLHILTCLMAPVFVAGLMCGYFPAAVANYIIAITLDSLVAYIELKVRVPVTEMQEDEKDISIYDNPEIWMNPDLTVTELARIIGTNRTYLWNQIKDMGYQSFTDMINRKRVDYICKELKRGTDKNIVGLMLEAGFRSRSTANREFKRIMGCTPSEYQEFNTQKSK